MTPEQYDAMIAARQASAAGQQPRPPAKRRPAMNHNHRQQPTAGAMNKTETRYFEDVLKPMLADGRALDVKFEAVNLRLASRTFYRPDFWIVTPTGIEIHEVKGHWEDDARVKIKVAAREYWWARVVAVQYKKKQWVTEEIQA